MENLKLSYPAEDDKGAPAEALAPRFLSLFSGSERSHGTYQLAGKTTAKGKQEGRALTVHSPAAAADWTKHLAGVQGLGIPPLRDDATVWFGAIDVDQYQDFDPLTLKRAADALDLPLAVCRSKSGGAHLYCFASEPVLAKLMRARLQEMAALLGHRKAEIFPKHDEIGDDVEKAKARFGNWINMPYFGGLRGMRYCLKPDGEAFEMAEFLSHAESRRQGPGFFATPVERDSLPKSGSGAKDSEAIPDGQRDVTLMSIAGKLRRIGLTQDEILAALRQINQSRCHPPKDDADIRRLAKQASQYEPDARASAPGYAVKVTNAEALTAMEFDPFLWAVDNMVPAVGVTILAGRPKQGKSYMALQFSVAIAGAKKALGKFATRPTPGRVLYFGLEDNDRRMKQRLEQVYSNEDERRNIDFSYQLRLDAEGLAALDAHLARCGYDLVVIDTFVSACLQRKGQHDPFRADYGEIGTLRQMAEKHKLALMLVHHTRKRIKGDDAGALDEVMGTTGVTAAADSIIVLRQNPEKQVSMSVIGKDTALQDDLAIRLEIEKGGWSLLGTVAAAYVGAKRSEIVDVLTRGPRKASDIAAILDKGRTTVHNQLAKLLDAGLVEKLDGGLYQLKKQETPF